MSSIIQGKGPIVNPGLCRCCGSLKRCRILNVEYFWQGRKEVYSEMFVDCFGLMLSHLEEEDTARLICATCVTRLRDANLFRQQVLENEERLLSSYIKIHEDSESLQMESTNEEPNLIVSKERSISLKEINFKKSNRNGSNVKAMEIPDKIKPPDGIQTIINNFIKSNVVRERSFHNALTIVENSFACPFRAIYNTYHCIYCTRKFIDPEKLREHTLNHNPKAYKEILRNIRQRNNKCYIDLYKIDCRLCDQKINDFDTFKVHIAKAHGKKLYAKASDSNDDFIILMFVLTGTNLKCMECEMVFPDLHSLKLHMADHFGTCVCDICGMHYFEDRNLKAHLKSHKPTEASFTCTQCGKTFRSKYNLNVHVARVHTKESLYFCNLCDENFFSNTLRHRHMVKVHNEEFLYKCKNCDKVYSNRKQLVQHNRRVHLKILKHGCPVCEKRFCSPAFLKEHMYSHTDEDALVPAKKPKRKSLRQKLKSGKKGKSKKINKEDSADDTEMLYLVPDEKLMEQNEFTYQEASYPQKQNGYKTENTKRLHNILTIIENSYACPFDTSFSDYFCVYCRQVFTDPNKLRDHSMTHDPRGFKDVLKNGQNNKKVQIDVYRIDCRLCPEPINDLEQFKNHITNHGKALHNDSDDYLKFKLTSGTLSCTECNSTFGFFHALKKHTAEHFGTCICDVCGAHYFEERMLALHQKTHQRVDETFTCKECGKSFKSKYTRYMHIARAHKKEAAYQCNKCDEVFFSYTLRYRHMIEVHGEERRFQCEQCDRAYDSRKSLREHNRRYHLKILKHQCDLCEKRFYLPSRLKEHMASHTGERNFRCEYCGKSYPRLRGLKVHMQSHSSDKKYKCGLCSASFTQNVNLKNHIKRQHQGMDLDENYQE
ncbi:jg6003 [Pararge aegeria aegeria]|uniref:Jg6003 protein n=3 Tax=Pararge aegeria TaxID=116150 RepID=A0A8S4S466_9NEOP|nr:jg6003 [Pararge aegeria aegeria]